QHSLCTDPRSRPPRGPSAVSWDDGFHPFCNRLHRFDAFLPGATALLAEILIRGNGPRSDAASFSGDLGGRYFRLPCGTPPRPQTADAARLAKEDSGG